MKLKRRFLGVLLLGLIIMNGCQNSNIDTSEKTREAFRVQYNNIKYFMDNSNYVCKWDNTMDNYVQIITDPVNCYTILNDKIYYNLTSDSTICRCDLDGTNSEKLISDEVNWSYKQPEAYKNYIFYINNSQLYRFDVNNNELKQITNDEIRDFHVMGDRIYYKNTTVKDSLCQSDLDGTNSKILLKNIMSFNYQDKDILIYSVRRNVGEEQLFYIPKEGDDDYWEIFYGLGIIGFCNIIEKDNSEPNNLYVAAYNDSMPIDSDATFRLFSFNKADLSTELITLNGVGDIKAIKNNFIYYKINDKYMKCDMNGLNAQEVEQSVVDDLYYDYTIIDNTF